MAVIRVLRKSLDLATPWLNIERQVNFGTVGM
jgi:hypothetical protein